MSGDMANAELGIATQDTIAADARIRGKDGLAAQQAWGHTYLNERMAGMALALAVVTTPLIYLTATTRFSVVWTGALGLLAVGLFAIRAAQRDDVDAIRAAQLAAHRAKTKGRGTEC